MRLIVLIVLLSAFVLPAPVSAEEEAVNNAGTLGVTEAVDDTSPLQDGPGLGTTGYGSPVLSDRIASGEIYGGRSGYVHPFLSIGGYHTDNLFRTSDNEESDWVAVFTPGIWFSLPASQQKLLEINLLNTAPGGLGIDRFRTEAERRFQGYALYRADIREHDRFTEENRVDHRAEGFFKISLRGGLSLELVDVYEVNSDPYGAPGTPEREFDKYNANLFNAILAYQVAPKLMLRANYGNYNLDYDAERNDYRDRTDDTYSAYAFYQATPKTAVFVQLDYTTIEYDKNVYDDSDNLSYFLGVEYKATAKTMALVKIGYGEKSYDEDSNNDRDDFLAEGRIDYAFTPKTSVYFKGIRRVLESNETGANNMLSTRGQIGYRQRILAKLRIEAGVFHTLNEYDGATTIGTQTEEREDKEFGGVFALGYSPVRWSTLTLGYEYRERNSNFDTEDYQDNTVFLRVTAAM